MTIQLERYFDVQKCRVELSDIESAERPDDFIAKLIIDSVPQSQKSIYTSFDIDDNKNAAMLVKSYFKWLSDEKNENSFSAFLYAEAENNEELNELIEMVGDAIDSDIDSLIESIADIDQIQEFVEELESLGLSCAADIDIHELSCSIKEHLQCQIEYDLIDCLNLRCCLVEVLYTPFDIHDDNLPNRIDLYEEQFYVDHVKKLLEMLSITPAELLASGLAARSVVNDDVLFTLLNQQLGFESAESRVTEEHFFEIVNYFSNGYHAPAFFFYIDAADILKNTRRAPMVLDADKARIAAFNGSSGSGDYFPLISKSPIHIDLKNYKLVFPQIDLRYSVDNVFGLVERQLLVRPVSAGRLYNISTETLANDFSDLEKVVSSENYKKYKDAGLIRERLQQHEGILSVERTLTPLAHQIIEERTNDNSNRIEMSM